MQLTRYPRNPILEADPKQAWESGAVFNCGATVAPDGAVYLLYRAVPRGYTRKADGHGYDNYVSSIGLAISEDGCHFTRLSQPVIKPMEGYERYGCEDPRVTQLEIDGAVSYLVTYTALSSPAFSSVGNRVALAATEDLRSFQKHGVVIPDLENKDAVIFPELVGGRIAMLHRVVPDIQIVYFRDLNQLIHPGVEFWKAYAGSLERFAVMRPAYEWEVNKIGAGPPPIKTDAGWLLIYHGVDRAHFYRAGAALLDLENPSRVIARTPRPILAPEEEYERIGDVDNVVFPTGAVVREGTLHVYYGGADKCCCLATVALDDLLDHLLRFQL